MVDDAVATPLTKDDVKDLIAPVAKDVADIATLLREQNGRLRDAEKDVAILKDRQPSRQAILWGSAAGGFMGAVGIVVDFILRK